MYNVVEIEAKGSSWIGTSLNYYRTKKSTMSVCADKKRMCRVQTDVEDTSTWVKFRKKMCLSCSGSCCSLPVEVKAKDLTRMGLMDEFEMTENLKRIAKRLMKERVVEHYHSKSETFTLSRMANGDCMYLDFRRRRCTIYQNRPDTCRNHPHIGPRPGFCAFNSVSSP